MAVIVVLAFVSILLLYIACNLRIIGNLGREIKLLEQRQIRRLESINQRTNSPIATGSVPGSVPQIAEPRAR